jgi:hypothetical protein
MQQVIKITRCRDVFVSFRASSTIYLLGSGPQEDGYKGVGVRRDCVVRKRTRDRKRSTAKGVR